MTHKARIVVHAGHHKTGSTALQVALRDLPPASGWAIAPVGRLANASGTAAAAYRDGDPAARAALAEAIAAPEAPNVVLSGEGIGSLRPGAVAALHAHLAPMAGRVEASIYLRPRPSFVRALFQETLKTRLPALDRPIVRMTAAARVRALDAAFGRDAVRARAYDPQAFPDGDVVAEFCAAYGIPARQVPAAKTVNRGLSDAALRLLYLYRVARPAADGPRPALMALLRGLDGPKSQFSDALLDRLSPPMTPDEDAWLAERLGRPLDPAGRPAGPVVDGEADLRSPPADALDWLARRAGLGTVAPEPDAVADALDRATAPQVRRAGLVEGLLRRLRR